MPHAELQDYSALHPCCRPSVWTQKWAVALRTAPYNLERRS
jgi:hypothetical protein